MIRETGMGWIEPVVLTGECAILEPLSAAHGAELREAANIEAQHRRLEVGSTWYRAGVQRTAINTECKRLLLSHAFERLSCIAVEFRASAMNFQSRRAIERLGAKQDGVLRSHQIAPNGTLRDTHVYSILAHEWPAVRANLDWQLARPRVQIQA